LLTASFSWKNFIDGINWQAYYLFSREEQEMTVEELNKAFLEMLGALDSQPTGTKSKMFADKSIIGIVGSEKAAEFHSPALKKNSLKENMETLGVAYSIAPALLAGMGSRESNLGATLQRSSSIYWGWGDLSKRKGEKSATYHGFGILQLDRKTAPFATVTEELTRSLGTIKLDPYEKRWLEWGVKAFLNKLEKTVKNYAKSDSEEQFATALSQYNGGKGLEYPDNDKYTTGKDYANDTLIRARWFAQNWEKIK